MDDPWLVYFPTFLGMWLLRFWGGVNPAPTVGIYHFPDFRIMNYKIGDVVICLFIPVDVVVITPLPQFFHCLIIGFLISKNCFITNEFVRTQNYID